MQNIKIILQNNPWNISIKIWSAARTVSEDWLKLLQNLLNT
jgi:hypothetical protein